MNTLISIAIGIALLAGLASIDARLAQILKEIKEINDRKP